MKGFYSSPLYKGLPVPLQNAFVTAKGFAYTSLRRGRRFAFLQKQLIDNEKLSADQLAALQLGKLQRMLRHASENVPFYQKQFRELGFDPKQLKAVDELKQLPILEKETIRKHLSEFVASNVNRRFVFKGSTSGSTGTPLSLYMDRKLIQNEHAFIWPVERTEKRITPNAPVSDILTRSKFGWYLTFRGEIPASVLVSQTSQYI